MDSGGRSILAAVNHEMPNFLLFKNKALPPQQQQQQHCGGESEGWLYGWMDGWEIFPWRDQQEGQDKVFKHI